MSLVALLGYNIVEAAYAIKYPRAPLAPIASPAKPRTQASSLATPTRAFKVLSPHVREAALVPMKGDPDPLADYPTGTKAFRIFAIGLHIPRPLVRALCPVAYIHAVASVALLDASIILDNYAVIVDLRVSCDSQSRYFCIPGKAYLCGCWTYVILYLVGQHALMRIQVLWMGPTFHELCRTIQQTIKFGAVSGVLIQWLASMSSNCKVKNLTSRCDDC